MRETELQRIQREHAEWEDEHPNEPYTYQDYLSLGGYGRMSERYHRMENEAYDEGLCRMYDKD